MIEHAPAKILIVKLSSLGDVVHTLPVLRTLRKNFPKAFIAWAVEEKCRNILNDNPDLDELILLRTKKWRREPNLNTFQEILTTIRRLRKHRFDWVLDLQGLIKSGVITRLTGAQNRVGFHADDCRERPNAWFNNHHCPKNPPKTHVIDQYLSFLNELGAEKLCKEYPLNIPESASETIDRFFATCSPEDSAPWVAINPGVGFATKRWNLQRFAELGDRMSAELGVRILLLWGPGEEPLVQSISSAMTQPHWTAPPTTVHEAMALMRRLTLFVSCDTGPMHLCCALGVPTVSIFGPTDPARNGPFGPGHEVAVEPQDCSYCFKRQCPHSNECMDAVSVDTVFQLAKQSLAKHIEPSITEHPVG